MVALALLITRLYAPLTGLASARVEVMSALVSFERVFEILDLKPLITEKPDARERAGRVRSGSSFDHVSFAYPSADKVSLASLEEVSTLDTRGGVEVIHDVTLPRRAGSGGGPGRLVRGGQVDHRPAGGPAVRRRRRQSVTIGGVDVRDLSFASLRQTLGLVTQDGHLFHASVRENLLLAKESATEERALGGPPPRAAGRPGGRRCRTGWTPSWGSGATGCPVASGSG